MLELGVAIENCVELGRVYGSAERLKELREDRDSGPCGGLRALG